MKVVNHAISRSELEDRQILRLTNGLREMETDIWGTDQHILHTLSHVKKQDLLEALEFELAKHYGERETNIINVLYPTPELRAALDFPEPSRIMEKDDIFSAIANDRSIPHIQAIRDHYQWMRDRTFYVFSSLPSELRLQIWGEIWGSIPRVHTIKEIEHYQFVSNQPPSVLLSICQESRSFYLESTNQTFAFNSYINFKIDTIYLRQTMRGVAQGYILSRLIECSDARKCEKLAVDENILFVPGRFKILIRDLMINMPRLMELDILSADARTEDRAFRDTNLRFVRASRSFIGMSHAIRNSFASINDSIPLSFTYRIVMADPVSIGVYTEKDEAGQDVNEGMEG